MVTEVHMRWILTVTHIRKSYFTPLNICVWGVKYSKSVCFLLRHHFICRCFVHLFLDFLPKPDICGFCGKVGTMLTELKCLNHCVNVWHHQRRSRSDFHPLPDRRPLFLHTVALKPQFTGSYKEVLICSDTFCEWAVLSLLRQHWDCVSMLTTSSSQTADVLLQPAMRRNKELLWEPERENCWLSGLSRRNEATQQRRGHHSDFILFTFCFLKININISQNWCETRRRLYITQHHMPAIVSLPCCALIITIIPHDRRSGCSRWMHTGVCWK